MQKFITMVLILIIVSLTTSPSFSESFMGKCLTVLDGDTICVSYEGDKMDVRLDGIDCPEETQEFHKEAKQMTTNLVLGKTILVEIKGYDQYGRCIAGVKIGYKDLALELVRAGLAWHYKRYSSDQTLAAAEEAARIKKIGIWSQPSPTAPWDYRQRLFNQMMPPLPISVDLPEDKSKENIVYITIRGECYHLESCPSIKGDKKAIIIDEAIKQGYRPCRVCNPPTK